MELIEQSAADLRAGLERVLRAWSGAAGLSIHLDEESFVLKKRDTFLRSLGPECCVGRSPFVTEGRGVAGWMICEEAADLLTRAILKLPTPPPHVRTSLGGPIDQGVKILQALFIEAWNGEIAPDWHLNRAIDRRIAERLHGMGTREVPGAFYPWVFGGGIEIEGRFFSFALAISPTMCVIPDQSYVPNDEITPWGGNDRAPVSFIDPTGEVARWLMEQIREGKLIASRASTSETVTATVTVGGSPGMAPVETLTLALPRG